MTLHHPYHFSAWFTFEGRCLLCGERLQTSRSVQHLKVHVKDGYMVKHGDTYTQVKEHPTGFPKSPYDK